MTPGNVYGHHQDPESITVAEDDLMTMLNSGQRLFDCEIDGKIQTTMFREVQWDTFATEIRHFDLIRIDANERVTVNVPIELRGVAPGDLAGGLVEQPIHELEVDCLAAQIPDSILVRINALEIGQSITVGDLELPSGVNCDVPPESTIIQISEALEVEEPGEEGEAGPIEPEVIGQKEESEEESD